MNRTYYEISAELYYRNKKFVELGIEPYEFSDHWWRAPRGAFGGQIFDAELSDYLNPHDILPNTNIIQASSQRLIEMISRYTDNIEIFQTHWRNAPSEFLEKNYQVFRIVPEEDLNYVCIEKSGFRESLISSDPLKIIRTIANPSFLDNAPDILRLLDGSSIYASNEFYNQCRKNKITGILAREIRLA